MDGLIAGREQLIALLVLAMSLAACGGLLLLQLGLMRCLASAPVLCPDASPSAGSATLTVVIPAYNEAVNIGPCLRHVLESEPPCRDWRVLVVDDASTDATAELATSVLKDHSTAGTWGEVVQAGLVRRVNTGLGRTGPAPGRWSRCSPIGCCSWMRMCV